MRFIAFKFNVLCTTPVHAWRHLWMYTDPPLVVMADHSSASLTTEFRKFAITVQTVFDHTSVRLRSQGLFTTISGCLVSLSQGERMTAVLFRMVASEGSRGADINIPRARPTAGTEYVEYTSHTARNKSYVCSWLENRLVEKKNTYSVYKLLFTHTFHHIWAKHSGKRVTRRMVKLCNCVPMWHIDKLVGQRFSR